MLHSTQPGHPVRFGALTDKQKKLAEALGSDPNALQTTEALRKQFFKRLNDSVDSFVPAPRGKKDSAQSNPIKEILGAVSEALADVLEPVAHVMQEVFIPIAKKFNVVDLKPGDTIDQQKSDAMEAFVDKELSGMLGYPDGETLMKDVEGPMTRAYNKVEQARGKDKSQ